MAAGIALSGEALPATKVGGLQPRPSRTFLDSNVLVYAEDSADPTKQQKAIKLILQHGRQRSAVISLQVLGEYFVTVTRKLHLDPAIARSQVEFYSQFNVVEPSVSDVLAAIDLHRLHRISYWDSLILRCAIRAGCRVLLSEDMQHGQEIDGLRIVNPFL
jgi:predicted nucleic acid-binding protein